MSDFLKHIQTYSGTIAGEEAAMYYADLVVKGGEPKGLKGVGMQAAGWTGGFFASLWTPDTALDTAMTLIPVNAGGVLLKSGAKAAQKAAMPGLKFLYNSKNFQKVSKAYWNVKGNTGGNSLHHWFFPQRTKLPNWMAGFQNAGFNFVELPHFNPFHKTLGLNQWMGFAQNWGPKIPIGWGTLFQMSHHQRKAFLVEQAIRAAIISSPFIGFEVGRRIGISRMEKDPIDSYSKRIYSN